MRKNILLLFMSLIFLMAANAQARDCCDDDCCDDDSNFYAKIFGGANFLQNTKISDNRSTYQTGYIVAGSVGYNWSNGLCLEAEYAYRRNGIRNIHFYGEGESKHGHFQSSSYMGNIIWKLPLSSWGCSLWNIEPLFGAGIGYDFQQIHSSNSRINFNQKWNQFSWQLMAGLVYPIFCNTEISLEYKFHQGGCHFNNHSVGIGIAYKFDFLR